MKRKDFFILLFLTVCVIVFAFVFFWALEHLPSEPGPSDYVCFGFGFFFWPFWVSVVSLLEFFRLISKPKIDL